MRFYARDKEIALLRSIEQKSLTTAQMTVITGRRRIGKTTLLRRVFFEDHASDSPVVYLFVGQKNEALLCQEFISIIESVLGEDFSGMTSFASLFESVVALSEKMHFTLILDEFSNIALVNSSLVESLKSVWLAHRASCHLNLIACGSLHSAMTRLFDAADAPFAGCATQRISLAPFSIATLKEILADYNPHYTPDDLLTFCMITGGVARYVEQLIREEAFTKQRIIRATLGHGSYFLTEGRDMLSDEFGKDSGTYFSILAAIADGCLSRGEITGRINVECGGYLDKLERIYNLISRHRPYLQPDNTRNVQYAFKDNFLMFWFRYVYRHRSAIEIGNLDFVMKQFEDDYDNFSAILLKKYFRQKYREEMPECIVSNYWEKGNQNEIDLLAADEVSHTIVFADCHRHKSAINHENLPIKARAITEKQSQWTFVFLALSLDDM